MLVEEFARFAVGQRDRDLPPEVTHAALRCVVDWFAAALPGSRMEQIDRLTAALRDEIGTGAARLLRDGRAAPARTAALINGAASHVAELDDIYSPGTYHPGGPTIAAALALGETRDVDGPRFLRAVVAGYEVGNAIAEAMGPRHYRFWHSTGTVGALGAATASAELLRLDAGRFAHALATATTFGAGLQQAFRSDAMTKPLHPGHAAEVGVLAALGAEAGMTGALDIIEGDAGFARAMSGDVDWAPIMASLGENWRITRMAIKPHVGCGHTFAPVDAALDLRAKGIVPEQVERIRVRTYDAGTRIAGIANPRTGFEGRFSIPYCVATALRRGAVRLAAFEPDVLNDPATRRLVERTELAIGTEFEEAFPHKRGASVTVDLTDGTSRGATRWSRRGDADDPLSDDELNQKFSELAGEVLGHAQAAGLGEALWSLPARASMRDLPYAAVAAPVRA